MGGFAQTVNFVVQANEDWFEPGGWCFTNTITGTPRDLTGWTFAMDLRRGAGVTGSPIIHLGVVTGATATGFYIPSPTSGIFYPRITRADLEAACAGQAILNLPYDLLINDTVSTRVYLRGAFVIQPGVTI